MAPPPTTRLRELCMRRSDESLSLGFHSAFYSLYRKSSMAGWALFLTACLLVLSPAVPRHPLLLFLLLRSDRSSKGMPPVVQEMGPMSRPEVSMLAVLCTTLVLWVLGPRIGVSAGTAAMMGLSTLMFSGESPTQAHLEVYRKAGRGAGCVCGLGGGGGGGFTGAERFGRALEREREREGARERQREREREGARERQRERERERGEGEGEGERKKERAMMRPQQVKGTSEGRTTGQKWVGAPVV